MMKKYVIERDIPGIGKLSQADYEAAVATSNEALAKLAPRIAWEHSLVAENKTFCVYLAEDEAVIQEHARISGFPANKVTEIARMIDPTTGS